MADVEIVARIVSQGGVNKKLVGFTVSKSPPHVAAHVFDHEINFTDPAIILNLIRYGYEVSVTSQVELVSVMEYLAARDVAAT